MKETIHLDEHLSLTLCCPPDQMIHVRPTLLITIIHRKEVKALTIKIDDSIFIKLDLHRAIVESY